MSGELDCSGLTDRGKVRRLNEDQFLIAHLVKRMRVSQTSLPDGHASAWGDESVGYLLAVADGMGGLAGGEIASGLAIECLSSYVSHTMPWFYRHQDGREGELEAELRVAVEACEKGVVDTAAVSNFRRMGTTLTLAYVLWPRAYVVHVGDSRCYLRRNDALHQVTRDHTVAQRAVDAGLMTPAEASRSRSGHALWNCIGGGSSGATPDLYRVELQPGDDLLLCSDGLSRYLGDDQILRVLESVPSAEGAAATLVAAANDAGGEDNVTVVVARARPRDVLAETLPDVTQLHVVG